MDNGDNGIKPIGQEVLDLSVSSDMKDENTAEADGIIKRGIVTVGEKNSLAKQAKKLQDAFKA